MPDAGVSSPYREGAETTQLHAVAARQRVSDLLEYSRHDRLDICLPQMRVAGGQFRDEFRFGHPWYRYFFAAPLAAEELLCPDCVGLGQ
jgi:hypothetical protein